MVVVGELDIFDNNGLRPWESISELLGLLLALLSLLRLCLLLFLLLLSILIGLSEDSSDLL